MKNLKFVVVLAIGLLSVYSINVMGAEPKKVNKYEAGRVIDKQDVELLNLIKGVEDSREWGKPEVSVDNMRFTIGQKINVEQARLINLKINDFVNVHNIQVKSATMTEGGCTGCGSVLLRSSKGDSYAVCSCK